MVPGAVTCVRLFLEQGAFARIAVRMQTGDARLRVLEPGTLRPLLTTWASGGADNRLGWEAPASGEFVIELNVPSWAGPDPLPDVEFSVDEYRAPPTQLAWREELHSDPRTEWLRRNAVPIRSIDPEDEDLSDLEFLRQELSGARLVLLGEADHGDGSDFRAKTRLIKFLHREMDFDVLVFESDLYGMSVAWRMLQADVEPHEAFLRGAFRVWAWSEQVQPLLHFVAASARTNCPLELAGFDSQFNTQSLTAASRDSLLPELRRVLRRSGIGGPLADARSRSSRVFARVLTDRQYLPTPEEQAELVRSLRSAAERVRQAGSERSTIFWAQLLRSASVQVDLALDDLREPNDSLLSNRLDRQRAENLLWLVDTYYQGRKLIVWTHTVHTMRNAHHTAWGRQVGFTMGEAVCEALRERCFAVGFTSYEGMALYATASPGLEQSVIPDQDRAFEFEELMQATGREFAWLNLRRARAGPWFSGAFLARPVYHRTERAPWSEVLDALVFIRTQEPSRAVQGAR
jgi:erythromycin esterase